MKNKYREGRRQVSFVVDDDLMVRVRAAAAAGRVSVTAFITGLMEEATSDRQQVSAHTDRFQPTESRRPDFGVILAEGRAAKSLVRDIVVSVEVDPIEEIA